MPEFMEVELKIWVDLQRSFTLLIIHSGLEDKSERNVRRVVRQQYWDL